MAKRNQILITIISMLLMTLHDAVSQSCTDSEKESYCKYWKSKGYCAAGSDYRSYLENVCRKTCGFCVDDPCLNKPCKNGGACKSSGATFTCSCTRRFEGKTCEKEKACYNTAKYMVPCANWKKNGFCIPKSRYYNFMQDHCSLECGFCKLSIIKEKKSCFNSEKYALLCPSWKSRGFCNSVSKYYGFMQDHCSLECGFCKDSCEDHGSADYCTKYQPYCKHSMVGEIVSKNCRKTCKVCQDTPVCGKGLDKLIQFRVVGGVNAIKNSWPWQALMLKNGKFDCGGTLIAKRWVVTAAHCLRGGVVAKDLKIILGDHDRTKSEDTEQEIDVLRIVRHPSYSYKTKENDIALLELEKDAVLNKYVGIACLPTTGPVPYHSLCYITGWGRTEGLGSSANILQEAKLPVVTNKNCSLLNGKERISKGMVCGGYGLDFSHNQSGCNGDSGGPFVCGKGDTWTLQGVVSWGSSMCISSERFTVFARVIFYMDWIKKTIL